MTFGQPLVYRRPIPLTPEEAFWHACTGTPWVQEYGDPIPVQWDSQIASGMLVMDGDRMRRVAPGDVMEVVPGVWRRADDETAYFGRPQW